MKNKAIQEKTQVTDQEINDLAEWYQDLTIEQLRFLKESYEALIQHTATEYQQGNSIYVQ